MVHWFRNASSAHDYILITSRLHAITLSHIADSCTITDHIMYMPLPIMHST